LPNYLSHDLACFFLEILNNALYANIPHYDKLHNLWLSGKNSFNSFKYTDILALKFFWETSIEHHLLQAAA
jgi:hypothetical protein